ncbi:MAG: molybdate ABC transporter substrate-binding protein [Planctomycetaceae bacterium]|jgi:molybdate transport system substrate-binding protein|nr:molybdate ABC transporter substrate-binding protein [Planctomycetaceae bacterium]
MKTKRLLLFVLILFCCSVVQTQAAKPVYLAAGAGLKDCLNEQIVLYKKTAPDVTVIPNYEASGKLQEQINNGAPVDVFISANQDKMDLVESKNLLVSETRKNLVTNKIVLIVPSNGKSPIHCFNCLGGDKLKIKGLAIGDPKVVPAGKYATEIFDFLEITDQVMPKVVFAQNVRAVLTYVAQNEVDAGIVYLTDALIMKDKVEVVAEAPKDSHSPVIFPAAIVRTGDNPDGGKAFLQFLFSPEAEKVFKKFGYGMAPKPFTPNP